MKSKIVDQLIDTNPILQIGEFAKENLEVIPPDDDELLSNYLGKRRPQKQINDRAKTEK